MISKDYIVNLEQGSYIYSYPEYHSRYNSIHGPASWRGGPLKASHGKDATKSFYGGVYGHLTAAVNLLATMRIGVLMMAMTKKFGDELQEKKGSVEFY